MYFIKNGLGKNYIWLATSFAVFGMIACFGIGPWSRPTPSA